MSFLRKIKNKIAFINKIKELKEDRKEDRKELKKDIQNIQKIKNMFKELLSFSYITSNVREWLTKQNIYSFSKTQKLVQVIELLNDLILIKSESLKNSDPISEELHNNAKQQLLKIAEKFVKETDNVLYSLHEIKDNEEIHLINDELFNNASKYVEFVGDEDKNSTSYENIRSIIIKYITNHIDSYMPRIQKILIKEFDKKIESTVKYTYNSLFIFVNTFNSLYNINLQYGSGYILNENNFICELKIIIEGIKNQKT